MRKLLFIVGMALAIGVLAPASVPAATGGSSLPFKGTQSGTGTLDLATGQLHAVTIGPFTFFGYTTFDQHVQVVFTGATFTYAGTWTATAANGDTMFGTSTGTGLFIDPVDSDIVGTYTSSGGTGRFTGASLTFTATVASTLLSAAGTVHTLSYDAEGTGQFSH